MSCSSLDQGFTFARAVRASTRPVPASSPHDVLLQREANLASCLPAGINPALPLAHPDPKKMNRFLRHHARLAALLAAAAFVAVPVTRPNMSFV
jgi:hypothetical protein